MPSRRLVSADLQKLLRQLNDHSLTLNVLRPLIVDSEAEVRQNVLHWVGNIQNTPDLDQATEQRLITVLTQLIEQKFKTLTYKELSIMIRLTPLEETISGQELIKNERVSLMTRQVQAKFALPTEMAEVISAELQQLDLQSLKDLFEAVLRIETVEQLESWIADHLLTGEA